MSGGDGAPGWTFEAAGLDFTKFHAADAAHVMQAKYDYARGGRQRQLSADELGAELPAASEHDHVDAVLRRPRLRARRARSTARTFRTICRIIICRRMRQVALRVRDLPHVIGFDTLNEPGEGMIGSELDYRHEVSTAENPSPVRPGVALSSLDALLLARGVSRELPRYKRAADGSVVRAASTIANPNGVSIWRDGAGCPFEAAGAYRYSNGVAEVLRNDYFTHVGGSQDRSRSGLHAAVLPSRRADGSRRARRLAAVRGDESIQGGRRSRVSAGMPKRTRECQPLVRHHGAAHEGVRICGAIDPTAASPAHRVS